MQRQPYAPLPDYKGADPVHRATPAARPASQWYRQEGEPVHREEQLCARVGLFVLRRRFPANEDVPLYSEFSLVRDGPKVDTSLWIMFVVPCVVSSKRVANWGTL